MKLLKAMATVAGLTGLSRIFGFIRDILTAAILGAGPVADAFFVALKLPNFFRRVTAEGAFSVSFVPLYSEKIEKEGEEKADKFASNAFSVMLLFLVPFTLLAVIFMPAIMYVIAPGFHDDALRYDLAVELSRVTFPYLLLISLAALMGGVLNAHDKFAPFAAAPIFFNVSLIVALLGFTPFTETAGHAMAWGIALAGLTQFIWLVYNIKKHGRRLALQKPEFNGNIKKLFKLMGPGVIGAGVMHINLFADLIIASMLASGSISYLYYADRLNQLPLGMVGIAVGTALLPMLSKAIAAGDEGRTRDLFNRALEICMLLALPASVALFVMPETLISTLFERGAFTSEDSALAANVLVGYAIGLPAYIAVKVFSTAYWSGQDTLSPVKVSVIITALNIGLSLILIWPFGVAGIAISTGLVGWIQLGLLYRGLKGRKVFDFDARFKSALFKIIFASFVMGSILVVFDNYFEGLDSQGELSRILILGALVLLGLIAYGVCIIASGAVKVGEIKQYLLKKK
ncbi:MAG: murein biosynthesis integral membrane protein MurJ [Alphaproteobacteria bacterium]|nr:murein biosynthesis integral membrane protein MurJ [Alphaproteobacteria bacterium]